MPPLRYCEVAEMNADHLFETAFKW